MSAGRLSLITLGVADVARATAFYDSVGFERSSASVAGEVSFYRTGGSVLALYGWGQLAGDLRVDPASAGFRGVTLAMNCTSEADVDATFDQWATAGAMVVQPPEPASWGGYLAYVADLDGHVWELTYNPDIPLSDDGQLQMPS